MITVTPAAARQILLAAEEAGMEEPLLRVAAQYDDATDDIEFGMGFDDRREQDEEIECEGVIVPFPTSRPSSKVLPDYVEVEPAEFRLCSAAVRARRLIPPEESDDMVPFPPPADCGCPMPDPRPGEVALSAPPRRS